VLREALAERRALVVPGCHDALSAKVIESAGFEAVQVSGFGLSGSLLARPDIGLLNMSETLEATRHIVAAVDVPVMADADTGGGGPLNAADTTRQLIEMGAAGMNIEDQTFPKRCGHLAGKAVVDAAEMAAKVTACAEVRDSLDPEFVINARTDAAATHGMDEAIRRCHSYLAAGADMVFIDAIPGLEAIKRAAGEIEGLLSVNLMEAVTGVGTGAVPIPTLRELGVARVSIPVASILVSHNALTTFFAALHSAPDGLGDGAAITPFAAYLDFVGLPELLEADATLHT
jgi:methylisocitrate lyase